MHIATKMHFLKLSCGCVAVVLINQRERGKRCPGVLAREWDVRGFWEYTFHAPPAEWSQGRQLGRPWIVSHRPHHVRRTRSLEEWRFYSARDLINLQLGTEAFRIHLFRIVPESFGQLHKS